MTLDDLTTYEQHEYDVYAADSYYARQYQVQCQYCRTTDSGTWEQLEHKRGWHLAKRETCPECRFSTDQKRGQFWPCDIARHDKCTASFDLEGQTFVCTCSCHTDDQPRYDRGVCDGCCETDAWVTSIEDERLCERCVERAGVNH